MRWISTRVTCVWAFPHIFFVFFCFVFFFKQKTAYEIGQWLEFRRVLFRSARFTNSDYSRYSSVSAMKKELGWESLQARRKIGKVVLLYKILNTHLDVRLELRPSAVHPGKFTQLHCRTVAYQRSFIPDTIIIWNSLPPSLTSVVTVDAFRSGAASALIEAY